MEYYVLIGGTQQGPHSAQELRDKLNLGEIGPDDLAWHEGLSDWQSLKSLLSLGLESNSSQTPPPLPNAKVEWFNKKKVVIPLVIISTLLFSPVAIALTWISKAFRFRTKVILTVLLTPMLVGQLGRMVGGMQPSPMLVDENERRGGHAEMKASMKHGTPLSVAETAQLKEEILASLHELEQFRNDPIFHAKGFSRSGRGAWMLKLDGIIGRLEQERTGELNFILFGARSVKGLAEEYLRSKGMETDSARTWRESIEDHLGGTAVTLRERTDFQRILAGREKVLFGDVPVNTLGDLIVGTMSRRIPWPMAESVVFVGQGVSARLLAYNADTLLYEARTRDGISVPFALNRTPEFERKISVSYSDPTKLYEELKEGARNSLDPLLQGHVLLTSNAPLVDLGGYEELFKRYLSVTDGKPLVSGSQVEVCFVKVIQMKSE